MIKVMQLAAPTITIDDKEITPLAEAVSVGAARWGVYWLRPVAVRVDDETIRITNVMHRVWLTLAGGCLLWLLLARRNHE